MNEPDFELTQYDSDEEAEAHGFRDLAVVEAAPAPLALVQHTREELEALKDTIKAANRDMTDAQFTVFMAAARHLGLDPLARQVVPIFQGGRMTVQTTIDGFRLIAERTRKYRGQVGPFWCGADGEWKDVWLADGAPAAAKVGVRRSDFDEIMWGVARFKSYAKGGTWNQMPDVMIAKVAESLALRKAFPAELSGAYTAEEMTVVDFDPTPPQAELHNYRAEKPASAPATRQAPREAPATAAATSAAARTRSDASGDAPDERVAQALRNRTVLGLLSDLGVVDQTPRHEKVAASFAILDRPDRPASIRDLIEALEAKIAAKKREKAAAAIANGYDLHDLPTGAMPN